MATNPIKREAYDFGRYRLIPSERVLLRNSVPITLSPKVFDVLLILVENQGHLVEKNELLDKVWADTNVEEATLAKTISRLRKTLGKEREFIETVAKSGYRLTTSVKHVVVSHSSSGDQESIPDVLDPISEREGGFDFVRLWFRRNAGSLLSPKFLLVIALIFIIGLAYAFRSNLFGENSPSSIKSFAVLPFKSVGKVPNQSALEIGMAHALITKLRNLQDVVVLPPSAIYRYAEDDEFDFERIGRELKVDAILDGTIRKDGQRLRVNVRLINVADGVALWSDRFDAEETDVFALQDTISERVANALELEISGKAEQELKKRFTINRQAYDSYIIGRYLWAKRNPKDLTRALEYFQKAAEIDPNYSLAYSGIADCYVLFAEYGMMPASEGFSKARIAAKKALLIEKDLSEAHAVLGYTLAFHDWNFTQAEKELKLAIKLSPNNATAHQWYGESLMAMGRFDEALLQLQKAGDLDPLSSIIQTTLASYYYSTRQYDKSIDAANKILEATPDFYLAVAFRSFAYRMKGMEKESVDDWLRAVKLAGRESEADYEKLKIKRDESDWKGFWQEQLNQIKSNPESYLAWDRLHCYLRLEDEDNAIEWLEKSFERRERWIVYLKSIPHVDPIRANPRFQSIIEKIRLDR